MLRVGWDSDEIPNNEYLETDEFSLSIDSGSGAHGDVVAVTVAVESHLAVPDPWAGFNLAICHDPMIAELVGTPVYSDEVISMVTPWGLGSRSVSNGINVGIGFSRDLYGTRFPSPVPLTLMTLYYRLLGTPGETSKLSFCDGVLDFGPGSCFLNELGYYTYETGEPFAHHFLTRRKLSGVFTVLDGPATHPDRPPEPPEAIVYTDPPTPKQANFRVRVTDAAGPPGARDIPVDVYAAADVEYTGIEIPLDFDERHLRLSRVENRLKPLASVIQNDDHNQGAGREEGYAVLFSGLGLNNRRLAAAREEIHVATLYFDILEAASAVDSTSVRVVIVGTGAPVNYPPWIGVRHKDGLTGEETVVRSEVTPITILDGLLAIRPEITTFIRGDTNGDSVVDLSDAQATLSYLYLGGVPPNCLDATDSNDDGKLNISDPIHTLQFLFLGGPPLAPPNGVPGEDPTPDPMGC